LNYADHNFEGRAGWREIVAVSDGPNLLNSSVPALDRSQELSNYPTDLLNSPPQITEATVQFVAPVYAASAQVERSAVSSVSADALTTADEDVRATRTKTTDEGVRATPAKGSSSQASDGHTIAEAPITV